MDITFVKQDESRGKMTIRVAEEDFGAETDKMLKNIRKKANIPGFRVGNAPMSLIKRQYGVQARAETLEKVIEEGVASYIKDKEIPVMGRAIISEESKALDVKSEGDHEVVFDLALRPEVKFALSGEDTIPYYNISVGEELIDQEVENMRRRRGKYVDGEEYDPDGNDLVYGNVVETGEDGNQKEGGISLEKASLMPKYFGDDDQKALFVGKKVGESITFNPKKAFSTKSELASFLKISQEEAEGMESDFQITITSITRFEMAEMDEEFFKAVKEETGCGNEEELRAKIKSDIEKSYEMPQDFEFLRQVRIYAEEKVGEVMYADDLLKKIYNLKDASEAGKDGYRGSLSDQFRWQTIYAQLVGQYGVKVEEDDILNMIRVDLRHRFAQYGMGYIPDSTLEEYVKKEYNDMEQRYYFYNLAEELKMSQAIRPSVKLEEKTVSLEEFGKLKEGK